MVCVGGGGRGHLQLPAADILGECTCRFLVQGHESVIGPLLPTVKEVSETTLVLISRQLSCVSQLYSQLASCPCYDTHMHCTCQVCTFSLVPCPYSRKGCGMRIVHLCQYRNSFQTSTALPIMTSLTALLVVIELVNVTSATVTASCTVLQTILIEAHHIRVLEKQCRRQDRQIEGFSQSRYKRMCTQKSSCQTPVLILVQGVCRCRPGVHVRDVTYRTVLAMAACGRTRTLVTSQPL